MSAISTFLNDAVAVLRPMGCAVAADVFGFITRDPADGGEPVSLPDQNHISTL